MVEVELPPISMIAVSKVGPSVFDSQTATAHDRSRRDARRRRQLRADGACLPLDFGYPLFAFMVLLNGLPQGSFASANHAGVMNSLPPADRGAVGAMNQTFRNSARVLSIGSSSH